MNIMQEVRKRVLEFKRENPLTISEIMKMNLYDYNKNLNERIFKEVSDEINNK